MKDNIDFIKGLYFKFLVSSTLAMLGSIVGQLVNNILIGNVIGPDILSVSSIVLPIYYVFASLGALIGVGTAAICAKFMGQNDKASANKAFTAAFVMTDLLAGVLSFIMLVNLDGLIAFLGATPDIYAQVYSYARIMILGGIFTMGMYPVFNFLRLDGKSAASVICFLIMGAVNILLNLLFLFTFDMGMAGVSLATSLGGACACGFGCFLLFFKSKNFKMCRPDGFFKTAAQIFITGSPAAVENISIALRSFCLNIIIVSSFGTMALSSFSILNSVNSVAIVLIAGICGTIIPFVGVFNEEKDTKSIRQVLISAFVLGGIIIIGFSVLCLLFPAAIAALFGMKKPAGAANVYQHHCYLCTQPCPMHGKQYFYFNLYRYRPHLVRKFAYCGTFLCFYRCRGTIFTALSFTFLQTDYEMQEVPLYNLLGAALLFKSCIAVFIFVLKMLEQVNEKARLTEQQREILEIIAMQKQQFKIITKHIDETRAMRHDLRHHLSAITGLANSNQFEELKLYLSKYEKLVHICEEFYFCANNTINSVVTYYLSLAKEEGIDVDYKFQLDMLGGLSDVDLCVVLGNCLENAINAAAMLPVGKRRIKVRAKSMCGNVSVIIDNSFDGIVLKENTSFISRKSQIPVAGIGLASVQRTVDKMNGMMKIEHTDNAFMVSILLPTEGTLNSSVK